MNEVRRMSIVLVLGSLLWAAPAAAKVPFKKKSRCETMLVSMRANSQEIFEATLDHPVSIRTASGEKIEGQSVDSEVTTLNARHIAAWGDTFLSLQGSQWMRSEEEGAGIWYRRSGSQWEFSAASDTEFWSHQINQWYLGINTNERSLRFPKFSVFVSRSKDDYDPLGGKIPLRVYVDGALIFSRKKLEQTARDSYEARERVNNAWGSIRRDLDFCEDHHVRIELEDPNGQRPIILSGKLLRIVRLSARTGSGLLSDGWGYHVTALIFEKPVKNMRIVPINEIRKIQIR